MELFLTFLEGVASFVSPCILPMIPIYISYILGDNETTKTTKLVKAMMFVLGFSVVFVSLGIFSATLGRTIVYYRNYINIIFGVFIVIIGLNYLNIISIKFLNNTRKMNYVAKDSTAGTAFLFGFFFAFGYTPCVGAFLGSALMMASASGSVLKGALYLLLYSIGLGIPFILSAVFLEKVDFIHNFIKQHYKIINIISGLMLVCIGIYMIYTGVYSMNLF